MGSLAITFNLLANADNEAASAALIAALNASQRDIRDLALTAVLDRGTPAAELILLRRWPSLSDRWKQQIADRPGWLSNAIRAAIVNRDPQLFAAACSAATFTRDYEAFPFLVAVATTRTTVPRPSHDNDARRWRVLVEGCRTRDYRIRRDPRLVRPCGCQPGKPPDYRPTARPGTAEAYLLLANRDCALKRILVIAPRRGPRRVAGSPHYQLVLASSGLCFISTIRTLMRPPKSSAAAAYLVPRQLAKTQRWPNADRIETISNVSAPSPGCLANHCSTACAAETRAIYLAIGPAIPATRLYDVIVSAAAWHRRRPRLAAYRWQRLAARSRSTGRATARRRRRCSRRGGRQCGSQRTWKVQLTRRALDSPHQQEREVRGAERVQLYHFAAMFDHLLLKRALVRASVRRIDLAPSIAW